MNQLRALTPAVGFYPKPSGSAAACINTREPGLRLAPPGHSWTLTQQAESSTGQIPSHGSGSHQVGNQRNA